MRAVVDVNVLISGVLSAKGPSAEILRASRDGLFELVVSELLLAELKRALAYPKLRKRIPAEKAAAFASWGRDHGASPKTRKAHRRSAPATPETTTSSPSPSADAPT